MSCLDTAPPPTQNIQTTLPIIKEYPLVQKSGIWIGQIYEVKVKENISCFIDRENQTMSCVKDP